MIYLLFYCLILRLIFNLHLFRHTIIFLIFATMWFEYNGWKRSGRQIVLYFKVKKMSSLSKWFGEIWTFRLVQQSEKMTILKTQIWKLSIFKKWWYKIKTFPNYIYIYDGKHLKVANNVFLSVLIVNMLLFLITIL